MIEIASYEKLKKFITAFGKKKINLLFIISRAGLGKTSIIEEALTSLAPAMFNGHLTPLSLYRELYERNLYESDFIAVFDDTDSLMNNKSNIALLKALFDTKETKTVKYTSTTKLLEGMENEFNTQCKTIVLLNDISDNKNIAPLISRANTVNFNPSDKEILSYLKTFAADKEIISFIETFVQFSNSLNLRMYVKALELKKSGLEWRDDLINNLNTNPRLKEIHDLLKKYPTLKDEERAKHFSLSRPRYFFYKKLYNGEYNKK